MSNLIMSEIIKDSFKFTLRHLGAVLGLGIVLSCLTFFEFYFDIFYNSLSILAFAFIILLFFFSFIEAGFCYRIYTNAINKLEQLDFSNFNELIHHGVIDFAVTAIYSILMFYLDKLVIVILYQNPLTAFQCLLLIVILIISSFVNVTWFLALLNLAYNDGKFLSAFNFKQIIKLGKSLGASKFWFTFFGCLLMDLLLSLNIFGSTDLVPVIYPHLFIINILITPFIIIFLKRFTAIASLQN